VLESSHDPADGKGEKRRSIAHDIAVGSKSKAICLKASCASHGVAQVECHSQDASHGTAGDANAYDADMAIHR
jgi:hypothetical protein